MRLFLSVLSAICLLVCNAQKKSPVYVDKDGVMRSTDTKKEVAYFGVNYTVPFAFGYRSHKALGLDIEKSIDADVYHLARLGIDAFRVHVWDTEISDTNGNLLENEHLRLYDYLLMRLKQRNIKILFTPLAYWGNGYPDKDENTPGFSHINNKKRVLVEEPAIKAQENYLKQILKHINPYTKMTYGDDPDVIALEINNEPHHSGPKEKVREYISRMVKAIKSSGWIKPIFYNISESSAYADVVASSDIQGVSFQWYPTGLVANHEQGGNFLPHVDEYRIPFGDTIPAYRNKARAVYEFDAADVMQPIMYPAMARSLRTAGFQWATQFAYDPLATANVNTEYQTHYLNLAYTPSKAISLLIASRVFHTLPRLKSYGKYPEDCVFDVFRVSYGERLSEMNSDSEFYYSNNTATIPKNNKKLKHVAGVGNSTLVNYNGSGAYFLDRIKKGLWRLEVLPDVVELVDPFVGGNHKKRQLKAPFHIIVINLFDLHTTSNIQPGVYLVDKNEFKKEADQFTLPIDNELIIWTDGGISRRRPTKLFDPAYDNNLIIYNPDGRRISYKFSSENSLVISNNSELLTGFQFLFAGKLQWPPFRELTSVIVSAKSDKPGTIIKLRLITDYGTAFSANVVLSEQMSNVRIPFEKLLADSFLLLPRPYPGFLPLFFKSNEYKTFKLGDLEKIEISFEGKNVVEIKNVSVEK